MYIFRYYTSIPDSRSGQSIYEYDLETSWATRPYAIGNHYITYFDNVFALVVL